MTLPDGQGVNTDDIVAVRIEEFFGGSWYVYVELRKHPRVTIRAESEESARAIARSINEGTHRSQSGQV